MSTAPIILFAYNRPHFTRQTIAALAENQLASESDLYIFADGPKPNATEEQLKPLLELREMIKNIKGFRTVTVAVSEKNKGIANSVINGITQILQKNDSAIIIEDDVVTSPFFLLFMNEALEKYKNDERVISIGSWNYYYHDALLDNYFIQLPDTIAWATWKRSWGNFEKDEIKLYNTLKERNLLYDFNLQNRFPYEAMLQQQIEGKVNSWAIRWTANALIQNKVCLYPNRSLSKHIGFGNDSTHVKSADYNADLVLADTPIKVEEIPVVNNPAAIEAFVHFEKSIRPLKTSKKKQVKHALQVLYEEAKQPFKKYLKHSKFGWFGNYENWQAALIQTTGYNQQSILNKVKEAVLKVKIGEAVYERDSVLFDRIEYSQPLLSTILMIAGKNKNKIHVSDFGGSLGSSYFQNKQVLDGLDAIQWNVVEQKNFVQCGKQFIEDGPLHFFETIDENIAAKGLPDLLLLSCTLPYIEKPYELLQYLASKKIPYVLIENTPFNNKKNDRLTIQRVNPVIYEASYPCWFLNKEKVQQALSSTYIIKMDTPTDTAIELDGQPIPYQSILFELK